MTRPDGKLLATIIQLCGGDERNAYTHAFAIDAMGVRYFILYSAIEMTCQYTLEDLTIGSPVWLRPIEHPKGWRGIEVEIKEIR